jgi:hypothetical protein
MELNRLPDGKVTKLALVRAIRNLGPKQLSADIEVAPEQIVRWEIGQDPYPAGAKLKRLSLALGWPYESLKPPHLRYEDAWKQLVKARKNQAVLRLKTGLPTKEQVDSSANVVNDK